MRSSRQKKDKSCGPKLALLSEVFANVWHYFGTVNDFSSSLLCYAAVGSLTSSFQLWNKTVWLMSNWLSHCSTQSFVLWPTVQRINTPKKGNGQRCRWISRKSLFVNLRSISQRKSATVNFWHIFKLWIALCSVLFIAMYLSSYHTSIWQRQTLFLQFLVGEVVCQLSLM